MPVYGGGDDENDWQPTSLITCRTPTHCSHWNQSLQPSHLQQRGRIGCWIKCLPVESENILHQYRFKNICKTGQTDIGMISRQSGKKTDLPCSREKWRGHPHLSNLHSLFHIAQPVHPNVSFVRAGLGSLLAKRYFITRLNSESCTAEMSAEKVLREATNNSKSRSCI